MARPPRLARAPALAPVLAAAALAASGCRLAPREQVDECHRLSQTLRSENARLKDQVEFLRSQNRDFSERAVDDGRRIAQLEETNRLLESSVQAYQDDKSRLESAYRELRASLPGALQPLSLRQGTQEGPGPGRDPEPRQADEEGEKRPARPPARTGGREGRRGRSGWSPSATGPAGDDDPGTRGDP